MLLKNGLVLYGENYQLIRADVLIEGSRIIKVGRGINAGSDVVIDCSHSLIIPGFVNAHTHSPMVLLRGLAEDVPLMEWLEKYIWPNERKLGRRDIYWGALLGLIEMARSGTVTFVDMYFHMEEVAKATMEVGLRGFLGYGMIDLDDEGRRKAEIRETEKFREFVLKLNSDLVNFILAPHAPYTCSLDCLRWVAERSSDWGSLVTIHLSETKGEVESIRKKYGKNPTEILLEAGLLNNKLIVAHGVWLSDEEISLLSKRGVTVAHCPASNMKLGSGVIRLRNLLDSGVNVALGTDGAASNNTLDMFREMRLASLLQKVYSLDPSIVKSREIFRMATLNGARALRLNSGVIEEGKLADIAIIDIRKPHILPLNDPISSLVFSAKSGDVDTLIVNGEIIILDGEFQTVDEEKVIDKFLGVL
ncbi:N-ethylammeline chlorohydrolase [Thermococcus chitonophagus]|uniref:5-methylthioadenosine/S-adenosylhomocysteine deaminase n=1 Tax=Thermococcus chitonophagus TaxID=54262 RepID=A0A160VTK7_9EURY|nr:amidohydrolase family protein [Thermococcus chitonophagus]ASJ17578.1 N-ethylammeline chlorohydrolase [Thermococcus chitonophagus]CUX78523.1 S-adenosylhomocysteine deaminase; Methylthioadenosine deaminase [Thermococcus chitonophagus]